MASKQKSTPAAHNMHKCDPNKTVDSAVVKTKKKPSSGMSPESMERYLDKCRGLLAAVHAPNILFTTNDSLNEKLFKPGPDRLELIKWLCCQIDEDCNNFSFDKLGEELMQFAVDMGLCNETNKNLLILGTCDGKEASMDIQAKFWISLMESVKDVRDFQATPQSDIERASFKSEKILYDVATSAGILKSLSTSSKLVNICPELLTQLKEPKDEQQCNNLAFGRKIHESLQNFKKELEAMREAKRGERIILRKDTEFEEKRDILNEDLGVEVAKLNKKFTEFVEKFDGFAADAEYKAACEEDNDGVINLLTSDLSQAQAMVDSVETNMAPSKIQFNSVHMPDLLKYADCVNKK